jgi:hypothetical protein
MSFYLVVSILIAILGFASFVLLEDDFKKRKKVKKRKIFNYSSFKEYLFSKRKLLIIWMLIHSFALFVNLCGIEGKLSDDINDSYTSEYRLFTTDLPFSVPYKDFWPLVGIYQTVEKIKAEQVASNDILSKPEITYAIVKVHYLRGIFFKYDISEFIAYNFLFLIVLYLRYDYLKNKLPQA